MEKRYHQLMDSYVQPELDADIRNKVKNILANVGVSRETLDRIETM